MARDKKTNSNFIQLIIIIVLFVFGMPVSGVIINNTIWGDYNYSCGMMDSMYVTLLEEELQTMYVDGEITDEQYGNLIKAYNEVIDAALNNSNITLSMVKNYNIALKESGISHYRLYQVPFGIKRSDGLKDGIKCRIYNNDVTKLYNDGIISEEEYNAFSIMYEEKEYDEDKVVAFIEYVEQLIQSVKDS